MKFNTPPLTPVFPFIFEASTLPNMPDGPEKTAALAWLAKPENNVLLASSENGENPDPRPFIASRILDLIEGDAFFLAAKFDPDFPQQFFDIIAALAPEYVHGAGGVPCYLTQYQNLVAVHRLRMIAHLRSLGFPCDEDETPGLQ